MESPEFWVAVAFVCLLGVGAYYKLPKIIVGALDRRAEAIAEELDNVRKLREEAQDLLASYQRKQLDAEKECAAIIAQAGEEAERAAAAAAAGLEATMERRTQAAVDKIAHAEAQAVKDVRNIAAGVTVGAARRIITEHMDKDRADALIEESIKEAGDKIH